jgi:hypothetical protein
MEAQAANVLDTARDARDVKGDVLAMGGIQLEARRWRLGGRGAAGECARTDGGGCD